jgi:hypothetical protein
MTESAGGALRVADVAAAVGGAVQGDPEHRVSGIAPLDRAGPTDLTFLASAKYARLLATCGAGAVLVTPELAETPGPCANRIVVAKPHDAMLQILPRLYRAPERPFIGVHATAVVDPSAQVDADVCVEAFAVIGRGARVGKGSWIGSHTVIGDGVELGSATHLFPHVTLYSGTRVGSRVAIHAGTRIGSDGFGYVYANGAHQKVPHVGGCVIGNDPIMDGSAAPFLAALAEAGLVSNGGSAEWLVLRRSLRVVDGESVYEAEPSLGLDLEVRIAFPHPLIGTQVGRYHVTPETFARELAGARTFGFVHEVEALRGAGLIQGASVDNAIVLDAEGLRSGPCAGPTSSCATRRSIVSEIWFSPARAFVPGSLLIARVIAERLRLSGSWFALRCGSLPCTVSKTS